MLKGRLHAWQKEKKLRFKDQDGTLHILSKRVALYRSQAKRANEMLFKEEQWYKELKQIQDEKSALVAEASEAIRELEKLIDTLYGQKRILGKFVGRNTPRRPRRAGSSYSVGPTYH